MCSSFICSFNSLKHFLSFFFFSASTGPGAFHRLTSHGLYAWLRSTSCAPQQPPKPRPILLWLWPLRLAHGRALQDPPDRRLWCGPRLHDTLARPDLQIWWSVRRIGARARLSTSCVKPASLSPHAGAKCATLHFHASVLAIYLPWSRDFLFLMCCLFCCACYYFVVFRMSWWISLSCFPFEFCFRWERVFAESIFIFFFIFIDFI